MGLKTAVHARKLTNLLQTNVIPLLFAQSLVERIVGRTGHFTVHFYLAIIIIGFVALCISPMSFKRTTANIHVADNHLVACCTRQLKEILLDGIFRKAVSNGQQLQWSVGKGHLHTQNQHQWQRQS